MVEETQSEIPTGEKIEADHPVVQRNLRLLERAYIPNSPKLDDPAEEEIGRYFLPCGERMMEDDQTMLIGINIRYNTRTGDIARHPDCNDPNVKDGDFSTFRTHLVTAGEETVQKEDKSGWNVIPGKYKILLVDPEGWLSPHAVAAAVDEQYLGGTGEDHLSSEGRWRLPERIIPSSVVEDGSNIFGVTEPWGKSGIVEDAKGDLYLFRAIEEFNKKHGPSLEEQFLRKAKT